MKWTRLVGGAAAAAAVVSVAVWQGLAFARHRAELQEKIDDRQKAAAAFRLGSDEEAAVRSREKALVASTLGPDAEIVDARFRRALNQILAACGVVEPVVSAGSAVAVRHPATKANELKKLSPAEEVSFRTLTATAQGRGEYEHVLAAVATIASQPWAHRVERVAVTPATKDRAIFDVEVVVTTLFLQGRAPERPEHADAGAPLWVGLDDAAQARLARLSRSNPFTDPPVHIAAAPVPVPQPQQPPGAPIGPAYDEWRITALVEGREGAELWLQRVGSDEQRTVRSGETILDARFEGADTEAGEAALVRIGGKLFEVALGRTLADRVEVSQ